MSVFNHYQPNWSWNRDTERWLKSECIGRTLNFPCGKSRVGDVHADITAGFGEVVADVLNPKTWPWDYFSFDTVVCDPPYNFYVKRGWIPRLAMLVKKRLILATPPYRILMKKSAWKKQYHITEQGSTFFIKMWQIFDRTVKPLPIQHKLEENAK